MAHRFTKRQLREFPMHPALVEAIDSVEWNNDDRELIIHVPEYHDVDMIGAINCAMAVSATIKQIQVIVNQKKTDACYVKVGNLWRTFHMKDPATYFGGRKNLRHP